MPLARILSVLALMLSLAACEDGADDTATETEQTTPNLLDQERAACLKRGGNFAPGGKAGLLTCFTTPKDAGKRCSGNSECEGLCLARSQSCAPVVPIYGCQDVILDGGARATVCLD